MVNIPEFLLRAMDAPGKPALSMRVVVGRAMRTETPVLEEDMKHVVFWPYWNVPPSILRSEFIPKIAKDPAYLQKNEYEVVTFTGQVVTDGVVSQDVLAQLRAGKLMVRQKPGPKNALGLVKFIFPNDKNIYLHSTPAQSLFGKTRRDFPACWSGGEDRGGKLESAVSWSPVITAPSAAIFRIEFSNSAARPFKCSAVRIKTSRFSSATMLPNTRHSAASERTFFR